MNGAGKATVVKTICGFLSPKAEQVSFLGKPISGVAPHQLIDLGVCCIPQESSLFHYLTVEENLLQPFQGRRKKFGGVIAQRYEDVLAAFPAVGEKRRAQAGDLSGGHQKQVEFAKAWLQ